MDPSVPEVAGQALTRQLSARVTPELHRMIRMRCVELDVSHQEFVNAALEMVLKAEIDPRSR